MSAWRDRKFEIKNLRKIALRDFGYFSCAFRLQITLLSLKLQLTQILIQTVANCLCTEYAHLNKRFTHGKSFAWLL